MSILQNNDILQNNGKSFVYKPCSMCDLSNIEMILSAISKFGNLHWNERAES